MSSEPPQPSPQQPSPQQVRLVTPAWAIVLVVVAGLGGMCVITGILVALLLPAIQAAREAARRAVCVNNMKQIGVALQLYHDEYNTFPPAYLADDEGNRKHSWRVLILPFLGSAEATALYEQYNFDEPWDGPNNSKLAERVPSVFRCPSAADAAVQTNYVAIVGDETMWPGSESIAMRKILDGMHATIAVVETTGSGVYWLQPHDMTIDEATRGINAEIGRGGVSSFHPGGVNVLFADGSVRLFDDTLRGTDIRALSTINGGEQIDPRVLGY